MSDNQLAARKPPLIAILSFMLAGTLVAATGARAAEWVERPFDPPAGSRWIIQSDETTEDASDGHAQTSVTRTTSELTIEGKIADGFRITYVMRDAAYEGDPRTAALIGPVTKALQNVVIRATTAANGLPLRIENLDEVLSGVNKAIDHMTEPLAGKPEAAAALRQMATKMLIGDDQRAPQIYLASLATLALGQNTGLRPGETRRDVDEVASPLSGSPIKSNTTFHIDTADPATGNVRLIRNRVFDPDAIKEFLSGIVRQLGGAAANAQQFDNFMKQFTIALDSRTEIDVAEGMTRAVHQEDTATAGMPGHSIVKHSHKVMTVSPAP